MDVQCWLYDVSELRDQATFDHALQSLPWEERRAKVLRYVFAKDRRLSLGASLVCAHALREAGPCDLALGYGEHGKPYLLNHSGVHFNLSHSGRFAVCAVAAQSVGVDVQERHDYDAGIAGIAFSEVEQRWVLAQGDHAEGFSRIWVRKESYLKLLGTGLTDDLTAVDVAPGSPVEHEFGFWEHTLDGHYLCVCTHGSAHVQLHAFSFCRRR